MRHDPILGTIFTVSSSWARADDLHGIARQAAKDRCFFEFPYAVWMCNEIPGHAKGRIITMGGSDPEIGITIADWVSVQNWPGDTPKKSCVLEVRASDWPAEWLKDIVREFKKAGVTRIVVISGSKNFQNVKGVNVVPTNVTPEELAKALGIKKV